MSRLIIFQLSASTAMLAPLLVACSGHLSSSVPYEDSLDGVPKPSDTTSSHSGAMSSEDEPSDSSNPPDDGPSSGNSSAGPQSSTPGGASAGVSGAPPAASPSSNTPSAGTIPIVAGDPPVPENPSMLTDCDTPGPRLLRRLSPTQYYRSLQSLFQDRSVPSEEILSNPAVLGFHADADAALVRDLDAELLMNYAERVADWAVTSKLNQLSSCTTMDASCRQQFISAFGQKAHREPLTAAQVTEYEALFTSEATFEDGARQVITAMLQSPYLLYRRELGQAQGAEYVLTPYEVASELSYLLTDAPPDQQLYDAAQNNRLVTAADIQREAERLSYSEYARETMSRFVDGWLEIDKLTSKAKNEALMPLPAELRASLVQEVRELFLHLFFEGGTVSDLFTADYSYLDQRAATFYGLNGPSGTSFDQVNLAGSNRATGILGQGAWLTTHALADNSSPVQRAKIVIERLLCATLPPVPTNLNTTLDTTTTFSTNRERYQSHQDHDECRVCHQTMDPIGFAFENYDAFGQWRTEENGQPVDATGSITYLDGGTQALDGVNSLSALLANSAEVQACVVRYWSYFTHGRDTWANSACNRDAIIRHAQGESFSLKSVLNGIIGAQHFSRRVADL